MMPNDFPALSPLDYHVLLALAQGELHGYRICQAVEAESGGAVAPRAGSLYRVIARLMRQGLVRESDRQHETVGHPGSKRKYYGLTKRGSTVVRNEVARLRRTMSLAEQRLGLADGDES